MKQTWKRFSRDIYVSDVTALVRRARKEEEYIYIYKSVSDEALVTLAHKWNLTWICSLCEYSGLKRERWCLFNQRLSERQESEVGECCLSLFKRANQRTNARRERKRERKFNLLVLSNDDNYLFSEEHKGHRNDDEALVCYSCVPHTNLSSSQLEHVFN